MTDMYKGCWNRTNIDVKINIATDSNIKSKCSVEEIEKIADEIAKIAEKGFQDNEIADDAYELNILNGIDQIRRWEKAHENNWKQSLFVTFADNGMIAVVGAGEKRLKFPEVKSDSPNPTAFLMANCGCNWANTVIRIELKNVKDIHKTGVGNLLKCRDGVEYLLGEVLLENDVPIINALSHRNWKYEYWIECKNKEYKKI